MATQSKVSWNGGASGGVWGDARSAGGGPGVLGEVERSVACVGGIWGIGETGGIH